MTRPTVPTAASVLQDLRDDLTKYESEKPRSLQVETGGSQLYGCIAEAIYRLRETERDALLSWDAFVGTAVHEALATVRPKVRDGVITEQRFVYRNVPFSVDCIIEDQALLLDYKGLALDTPIPIPAGWTTMEQVGVGDEVFASDGRAYRVTAKSQVKDIGTYVVRFSDGTQIVCDREHLWAVRERGVRSRDTRVVGIETMARRQRIDRQARYRVDVARSLDTEAVDLPLDPYVLGAWLGDGCAADGKVCGDEDLFDQIRACGYAINDHAVPSEVGKKTSSRTVHGIRGHLRALGVLGDKHVPAAYLRASAEQRLALLQGLMDTDGSWNRRRRRAVFVTTGKQLALDVTELLASLGQKPNVDWRVRHGFGLNIEACQVEWTPLDLQPFRLPRKASLVAITPGQRVRAASRTIVSITAGPDVPTVCIAVDSPDRTYLCGSTMIPTHNTDKDADDIIELITTGPPAKWIGQTQGGAAAARDAGIRVDWVAVIVLPRSGDLDGATVFGPWPFDQQAADEAAAWSADVDSLALDATVDPRDHRGKPAFWCFAYCEFARTCRGQHTVLDVDLEELAVPAEAYATARDTRDDAIGTMRQLRPLLLGNKGRAGRVTISTSSGYVKDELVEDVDALRDTYRFVHGADAELPMRQIEKKVSPSLRVTWAKERS